MTGERNEGGRGGVRTYKAGPLKTDHLFKQVLMSVHESERKIEHGLHYESILPASYLVKRQLAVRCDCSKWNGALLTTDEAKKHNINVKCSAQKAQEES
jgi:predicted DNA-binding protein (MmcQ/YjbR family)